MSGSALPHQGISGRVILPVYHGDCRFNLQAYFLNKLPTLSPMRLSLVRSTNTNNHRPRSSDMTRQQKGGSFRRKSKPYQEKDNSGNIDEIDSDMLSKNGPPIALTSNSRPQAASVPGEREKEIVELFKRVQAQLRARGRGREEKKPETTKVQGERGSVDSLLKLLRKHSVDQRRKRSDEKELNVDQTRRSNDFGNKKNTSIFNPKDDTKEEQKRPHPASFKRPPSNFRRRSPVPGVKFQPVINTDSEPIADNITSSVERARASLEKTAAEPNSVSPFEPDSVIPPENPSLHEFDVHSDDESETSDTDESNGGYLEPSLERCNFTDIDESHRNNLEFSRGGSSDISSLKVTELRELAKSHGFKGYSKMKKNELVELLSNMA